MSSALMHSFWFKASADAELPERSTITEPTGVTNRNQFVASKMALYFALEPLPL